MADLAAFAAIVILPVVIALTAVYLRTQARICHCPRHPHTLRGSGIRSQLIDTGMRKQYWCPDCPWWRII